MNGGSEPLWCLQGLANARLAFDNRASSSWLKPSNAMPLRPVWPALGILDPVRIHHLDIRKGEALADQEVQVELK